MKNNTHSTDTKPQKLHKLLAFALIITIILISFSSCSSNKADFEHIPSFTTSSDALYVANINTDMVLFEQNSNIPYVPNELTQLLTLILAFESGLDLDEVSAEITQDVVDIYKNENVPTYGFVVGEKYSLRQLLEILAITKSYDAAYAIEKYVSTSYLTEEKNPFIAKMNEKAKSIGTSTTHFDNSAGVYTNKDYTSAKDMYTIAKYAMGMTELTSLLSQKTATIPATTKQPERTIQNTNPLVTQNLDYTYIPLRDGFSSDSVSAGDSCVSGAIKDGNQYIVVALSSPMTTSIKYNHTQQDSAESSQTPDETKPDDQNPDSQSGESETQDDQTTETDNKTETTPKPDSASISTPLEQRPALLETNKFYQWLFQTTALVPVAEKGADIATIPVDGNFDQSQLNLTIDKNIENAIPKNIEIDDVVLLLKTPPEITNMTKKGDFVGVADIIKDAEKVGSVSLVANESLTINEPTSQNNNSLDEQPKPSSPDEQTTDPDNYTDSKDDEAQSEGIHPIGIAIIAIAALFILLVIVRQVNLSRYKKRKRARLKQHRPQNSQPHRNPQAGRPTQQRPSSQPQRKTTNRELTHEEQVRLRRKMREDERRNRK